MAQILRQGLDDIDNEPAVDAYVELREIDLFTALKRRRCVENTLFAAVYDLHSTRVIDVHVLPRRHRATGNTGNRCWGR